MRLYLGGKMVGVPGLGFGLFDHAAATLRSMGHEVFNPAEYDRQSGYEPGPLEQGTYEDTPEFNRTKALLDDVTWILTESEGMVALENWVASPGTRMEIAAHQAVFKPVWEYIDFVQYGDKAMTLNPLMYAGKAWRQPHETLVPNA